MPQSTVASAYGLIRAPIVDSKGVPTVQWSKWFLDVSTRIENALTPSGTLAGTIAASAVIEGRTEGIGTTVENIDSTGVILPNGIDFARPYLHKDTDHITDGTGSPLAGGRTAYAALVASSPTAGEMLGYTGTAWLPQAAPASLPKVASEWLDSYNATTGVFTQSQPAFSDISGVAAPAQLPVATSSAFGVVKPDNTTITISGGVITAIGGGSSPNFADEEVPSGSINGSNVTFTLAHPPSPAASLILSLAGLVQWQNASGDYTLSGATITFGTAPAVGPLLAWYRY